MLPRAAFKAPGVEAFGMTRPANTVGGDFYDILPLPDGRVLVALGDVAGKGSPAALLMALLLAMLRTLVDEGLERADAGHAAEHAGRAARAALAFITLFFAMLESGDRRADATSTPARRRRCCARQRHRTNGCAPAASRSGMFEDATYDDGRRRCSNLATCS